VKVTRAVQRVVVTQGDGQVASLVGLHLLGDLADRVGLTSGYSTSVPWAGERAPAHDRGRLLAQVAVMLAGGGECVSDMAALRDQPDLFGEVASAPTIWRALDGIDDAVLAALRCARASARSALWAKAGSPVIGEVIIDVDAAVVEIHSANKQQATSHFKGGFGFHPMFATLDATGETLAGMLRAGNATANSGADQLAVVDLAVAQLPVEYRQGHEPGDDPAEVAHSMVVRADSAGAVAGFVAALVDRNICFSVYARVNDTFHQAICAVPDGAWVPAVNSDGQARHSGEVAELDVTVAGWPAGTRAICRREQPHPGAQLKLWDRDGWRHQVTLTNSVGDALALELRQRRHARVENTIKALRDTGLDRMPFSAFDANSAWLELVITANNLLVWLQTTCLDGDLAVAAPKSLRYRILHCASRVVHRARQVILRLPRHWPWATQVAAAYQRVAAFTT
jgi:hypothetical protein